MKIQTMSIVVGTRACNARCPFCVSKMTGFKEPLPTEPNWVNLEAGCRLAVMGGVTTVLLTGKGEPTLYPDLISSYLVALKRHRFPFVELQTNGLSLTGKLLAAWKKGGLTTVCLSAVHWEREKNRTIYSPDGGHYDMAEFVRTIHEAGLSVRLSIMMIKGMVCSPDEVDSLVDFCRKNRVEQLTIRPISKPSRSEDAEAFSWVSRNRPTDRQVAAIERQLKRKAVPLMDLAHGARVYDYDGQNICLSTCLTLNPIAPRLIS